jgi:hypothetical protein
VIVGPFGGTATHREGPSLPWRQEAQGSENEARQTFFWLKTGIAPTERQKVEEEEAAAGVPTERRTGCYHNPPTEVLVRKPGYTTSEKEEETVLRPTPRGCIGLTLVSLVARSPRPLTSPAGGGMPAAAEPLRLPDQCAHGLCVGLAQGCCGVAGSSLDSSVGRWRVDGEN